jgi:hypothetical protein
MINNPFIENVCVPHHITNLLILSFALTMLDLVSAPSLLPVQVQDHGVPHLQARKLFPDMDLLPTHATVWLLFCSPGETAKTSPAMGPPAHTAQLPLIYFLIYLNIYMQLCGCLCGKYILFCSVLFSPG